jgi:hypothetical protein
MEHQRRMMKSPSSLQIGGGNVRKVAAHCRKIKAKPREGACN